MKPKYRIVSRYPCYNGCLPITGYFVQRLQEGFFSDKWIDIKGFDRYKDAENLLKILQE